LPYSQANFLEIEYRFKREVFIGRAFEDTSYTMQCFYYTPGDKFIYVRKMIDPLTENVITHHPWKIMEVIPIWIIQSSQAMYLIS